jgi:hypothetical protein
MDQGNNKVLSKAYFKPEQNFDTSVMERKNCIGHPTCEPDIMLLFSQEVGRTLSVESQFGSYRFTTIYVSTSRPYYKAILHHRYHINSGKIFDGYGFITI